MMPSIKFLDRANPQLALDDVREKIRKCYGISGEFASLDSERDQNYRITTTAGDAVVLKISNALDAPDIIDFQTAALQHIEASAPSLPVPRVILTLAGKRFAVLQFNDRQRHVVHMLSWLPGQPMATASGDLSPARRELGGLVAAVDGALQDFFHPAADHDHPWNIGKLARFLPLTRHIENAADRKLVTTVLEAAIAATLPALARLRHQVVHQDAHGDNVLLDPGDPTRIVGLLDFGDMTFGSVAAEIAVACEGTVGSCDDAVDAICDVVAGYDAASPLLEPEIDLIYDLVMARSALTATIFFARKALANDNGTHMASAQPTLERLRELQSAGRRAVTQRLRSACRFPAWCPDSPDEALDEPAELDYFAARKSLLGKNTTYFYSRPLHFERASGCFLHGTDGHAYLDCYNNVPQVGHCNPHVVKAIARQAAALNTNTRYLYGNILEYAQRLTDKLAPHLDACIFVNSGSEANDVAWQMAKATTGNSGGLLMEDAYHGITEPIREFSPGHPATPLPDHLRGLLVPDPYRGPYRENEPELATRYAADADRAIAELHQSGQGVAAFMVDSAFCSSGVPDVPLGYLRAVAGKVQAAGGLMICDEVQSGFGRMGQWWGHEYHGVTADIVTLGKPVGNGHPLGVVITSQARLNEFIDRTRLFSTFGGNPVACAAGLAVLDVIEREQLIEHGVEVGDYLRAQLRELAARHELIGDVRGRGMLGGLEFVSDRKARAPATRETARLLELMRERRVLVGKEGRDGNILKLRPALVFERDHVDLFVAALDDALNTL